MTRFYNQKVKERPLTVGDLVLHKMEAIRKGLVRVSPPPIGRDRTLYTKRSDLALFVHTLQGTDVPRE